MDAFRYRAGELHAEDVALARIAEAVGTPFYCYSLAALEDAYRAFAEAFSGLPATICYAVKANGNLAVIRALARLGAGADVVSEGELERARIAGVPASRIVFSGVGKSAREIRAALDAGVMQINVESEAELGAVDAEARARGTVAPVALRINPDVDALTHHKITTGRRENKFGIDWTRVPELLTRARALSNVRTCGIAVHIGSQLVELAPFRAAYRRLRELTLALRAAGHVVERLDLGGGLGICYGEPDAQAAGVPTAGAYAAVVRAEVGDLGCRLVVEPGRALVGKAGLLVTRVVYVKDGATRTFVIVDAAMNDLLRPALYDAYHAIEPVRRSNAPTAPVDIVGPVCETADTFATQRPLPPVGSGDLLAIRAAGAYGAAMASAYNARPLVAEVMVNGASFAVVRERIPAAALARYESIPAWLEAPAAGAMVRT